MSFEPKAEDLPISQSNLKDSSKRLLAIVILSWFSMLGFDFFLHAGLLASFYLQPSLFLLPPMEAFRLIPLGYLSFLLLAMLVVWLVVRLKIVGWCEGLGFGLKMGCLFSGAGTLGLLSISTADVALLVGWFFGQSIELGIAGAVAGSGSAGASLSRLSVKVFALVLILFVVTVVLQSLGLAPARRL